MYEEGGLRGPLFVAGRDGATDGPLLQLGTRARCARTGEGILCVSGASGNARGVAERVRAFGRVGLRARAQRRLWLAGSGAR